MKYNATVHNYILSGCNWELTLGCTLSCMHCGSRAGRARQDELTLDECFTVADQLVSLGCKETTLIGGEVFLFPGWDRLSAYLTDKGIAVNIISNGYVIGKTEIEQIKRAKLMNIGLSIDGMETNHNRVRGRNDAFQRIKSALCLLNEQGIKVGAITSLMRFNCSDLEDLYTFLSDNGVEVWQIQLVSPMGNMEQNKEAVTDPDQVRQILDFIRDKNRNRQMVVIAADSLGYFDDNEAYVRGRSSLISCWGGCAAGVSSIFIDSIGNIKGCGALYSDDFIEGNLRITPLSEIWNSENAFAYNRKFTTDLLTGKCKDCEVGDVCKGGCRSSNYFNTKSPYSSVLCCRQ